MISHNGEAGVFENVTKFSDFNELQLSQCRDRDSFWDETVHEIVRIVYYLLKITSRTPKGKGITFDQCHFILSSYNLVLKTGSFKFVSLKCNAAFYSTITFPYIASPYFTSLIRLAFFPSATRNAIPKLTFTKAKLKFINKSIQ